MSKEKMSALEGIIKEMMEMEGAKLKRGAKPGYAEITIEANSPEAAKKAIEEVKDPHGLMKMAGEGSESEMDEFEPESASKKPMLDVEPEEFPEYDEEDEMLNDEDAEYEMLRKKSDKSDEEKERMAEILRNILK